MKNLSSAPAAFDPSLLTSADPVRLPAFLMARQRSDPLTPAARRRQIINVIEQALKIVDEDLEEEKSWSQTTSTDDSASKQ